MQAVPFSRILCPVTFSQHSQQTVEGAAVLAAMHNAELRLFHVLSDPKGTDQDAESLVASLFALSRRLPERLRVSAAIAYGDPSSEIRQHARLMRADLIVLGAERRSAPADFAHTVPGKVLTGPPCHVLIVRPRLAPALADADRGFAEILWCADFLASSFESARYVQAMTHSGHARVTILNIVSQDNDEAALADENASYVVGGMHAVHVVLTGSPGPEIVALAQRIQSDLIVMGAHEDVSQERQRGSTLTYVISCAPCPVLIVPLSSKIALRTCRSAIADERDPCSGEISH